MLLVAAMQEKDVSRLAEIVKKRGGSVVVTRWIPGAAARCESFSGCSAACPALGKDWKKLLKAQKRPAGRMPCCGGGFLLSGRGNF